MHHVAIRQEIIDRVLARRGRHHLFNWFDAAETALVVIDMQPTFVAPETYETTRTLTLSTTSRTTDQRRRP